MRILVIDDNATFRKMVCRILESAGHEMIEAEDGHVGLDAYRKQPVDVVIVDIFMPQADGFETIRAIRAIDSKVRIVAMSGSGRIQHVDFLQMAGKLGANETLAKPFRRAALLACIEGRQLPPKGSKG